MFTYKRQVDTLTVLDACGLCRVKFKLLKTSQTFKKMNRSTRTVMKYVTLVVLLVLILQNFCVEAGGKEGESVIVINAGGGGC